MKSALVAIVFGVVLLASYAQAASVTGRITRVSAHMDNWTSTNVNQRGLFFIEMKELSRACGKGHGRVVIPTTHPLYDTVVGMATKAMHEGSMVTLAYLDSCTTRSNSWDFAILNTNA